MASSITVASSNTGGCWAAAAAAAMAELDGTCIGVDTAEVADDALEEGVVLEAGGLAEDVEVDFLGAALGGAFLNIMLCSYPGCRTIGFLDMLAATALFTRLALAAATVAAVLAPFAVAVVAVLLGGGGGGGGILDIIPFGMPATAFGCVALIGGGPMCAGRG